MPALVLGVMVIIGLVEGLVFMQAPSIPKLGFVLGFIVILLAISYWSHRAVFAVVTALAKSGAVPILRVFFWLCIAGGIIALVGFPRAGPHSFPVNHLVFVVAGGGWAAVRAHEHAGSCGAKN